MKGPQSQSSKVEVQAETPLKGPALLPPSEYTSFYDLIVGNIPENIQMEDINRILRLERRTLKQSLEKNNHNSFKTLNLSLADDSCRTQAIQLFQEWNPTLTYQKRERFIDLEPDEPLSLSDFSSEVIELLSPTQTKDPVISFEQLVEILRSFSASSGSAATTQMRSQARHILPKRSVSFTSMMEKIFLNHPYFQNLEEIKRKFAQPFLQNKNSVTHFPSARGDERKAVHAYFNDLMRLITSLLASQNINLQRRCHHEQTIKWENGDNEKFREAPDFSILKTPMTNELPFTYNQCLLVMELKIPGEMFPNIQTIHYMIDRARYQIELERSSIVNLDGYGVACDGYKIQILHLRIVDNHIDVFSSPSIDLFPSFSAVSWKKLQLNRDQCDGFCALIALLTASDETLGLKVPVFSSIFQDIKLTEVLGIGAFGTVCLGLHRSGQKWAIKCPHFYGEKQMNRDFNDSLLRIENEVNMLTLIETALPHDINILKMDHFDRINHAIYFTPVCMNMMNYVLTYMTNSNDRLLYARDLISTLTKAMKNIHNRTGITRRDIRPPNVLMDITVRPHIPKLCDWGIASTNDVPYHPTKFNLDLHHDNIIRACYEINSKAHLGINSESAMKYEISYDCHSIFYTGMTVNEHLFGLEPLWTGKGDKLIQDRQDCLKAFRLQSIKYLGL